MNRYFVIDFDSTFIKGESLDILAEIALKKDPQRLNKLREIKTFTDKAMNGEMDFGDSLQKRIKLLSLNQTHLEQLVRKLKKNISPSILRNRKFFEGFSRQIIIVSGGFREYILPVVEKFHILPGNVYANRFKFDKHGNITGFDRKNILSRSQGKVKLLKSLNLDGEIIVIGDGYTDYELKKAGFATKFYAFTENKHRKNVTLKSDHIIPSFDEFLYVSKLPMSISYPKNRIRVLLLENIHPDAEYIFKSEGYDVECIVDSLSEEELCNKIKNFSILGIRSKTRITEKILSGTNKLHAIGAFCVGTNQIDLNACSKKGVIVFNAPFSNTRSVVELVIGSIIMLERKIFDSSVNMHNGIWDKSSRGCHEVRAKKLGIIGYGKIGSQLSVLAEDMGMEVYFYDKVDKLALGNARKCRTLKELLRKCDIISVHVDGDKSNDRFISGREFALMKDGVIFINLSRGFVVDLKSLAHYIKSGKIKGAAIDVFPEEPVNNNVKFVCELQGLPNVILTPHIGGSTEEAQKDIANYVPEKIINFINSGNSYYSINFPNIQLPPLEKAHRLIHIHNNVPGILGEMNSVFARHSINIIGQYLKTNELIGYVITDISRKYNPSLISELKKIPGTIKLRILY